MNAKFPIITVSGAQSGIGKTIVIEELLKRLQDWSALKVTVMHSGSCPTSRDCGACDKFASDFLIADGKKILSEGKDTHRFKKAGAQKVLWLRSRPEALKRGLVNVLSKFDDAKGLIIESTSALKYLKPDLAIFVIKKDSILKPSAQAILKRIDLVVTM